MSIEAQLRTLNRNEITVLFHKCKGLKYAQIASKLDYSTDWVQLHMSHVYTKLGFNKEMHWTKRTSILENEVCPRLPKRIEDWSFDPEPLELTEGIREEPKLDPEIRDLVLYDEMRLAKTEKPEDARDPEVIVIPEWPRQRNRWGRLVRGCTIVILLVVVGYLAFRLGRSTTTETPIAQPANTNAAAPAQASNTAESILPTDTAIPLDSPTPKPSDTPAPPPTVAFVPPADGILFQDNFENGLNPEWQAFGNNWLVADGELTLSTNAAFNNRYEWIGLNHPEWKNYILSLDVMVSTGQRSPFGYIAIVVRDGAQLQDLGVAIDTMPWIYWATIGGDESDTMPISGQNTDRYFGSGSTVEITVQGNNYSLRVNGQNIQIISMSGYDTGGINLGIECHYALECPSFDNVKVTYLP